MTAEKQRCVGRKAKIAIDNMGLLLYTYRNANIEELSCDMLLWQLELIKSSGGTGPEKLRQPCITATVPIPVEGLGRR